MGPQQALPEGRNAGGPVKRNVRPERGAGVDSGRGSRWGTWVPAWGPGLSVTATRQGSHHKRRDDRTVYKQPSHGTPPLRNSQVTPIRSIEENKSAGHRILPSASCRLGSIRQRPGSPLVCSAETEPRARREGNVSCPVSTEVAFSYRDTGSKLRPETFLRAWRGGTFCRDGRAHKSQRSALNSGAMRAKSGDAVAHGRATLDDCLESIIVSPRRSNT